MGAGSMNPLQQWLEGSSYLGERRAVIQPVMLGIRLATELTDRLNERVKLRAGRPGKETANDMVRKLLLLPGFEPTQDFAADAGAGASHTLEAVSMLHAA